MRAIVLHKRPLLLTTIFAIALAFLESAVVVYLRKLYYPEGFEFPLVAIPNLMAFTELGREAATLVMLVTIGIMMGRTGLQQFAYFLYCFAVWDIFYYIWLKVILGWPASLMTWDILFLIPVPWVGPVIVPIIASLTMIVLTVSIIVVSEKHPLTRVSGWEWTGLIGGSLTFILACIWDYSRYVIENHGWGKLWTTDQEALFAITQHYIPAYFNWPLFLVAEALIVAAIISFLIRHRQQNEENEQLDQP